MSETTAAIENLPDPCFPVPAGFKRLPWTQAVKGQVVWLLGVRPDPCTPTKLEPAALGPYRVHDHWWLEEMKTERLVNEPGERLIVLGSDGALQDAVAMIAEDKKTSPSTPSPAWWRRALKAVRRRWHEAQAPGNQGSEGTGEGRGEDLGAA